MNLSADPDFVRPTNAEPSLPLAGENNLWYLDRGTDTVIVFVHGIMSDSQSCWLHQGPPLVYWPNLVSRDARFDNASLYLGGYYTDVDSGRYKVRDCADELFRALGRQDSPGRKPVLERKAILFICHSMGGIVTRYMLDRHTQKFTDKIVGLLLIASPSTGSAWAARAQFLTTLYGHEQGRTLEWGSDGLDDLDQRFFQLLKEGRLPRLHGAEAYENHFMVHRRLLPNYSVVVERGSAERYFAPARLLRQTNHSNCVKPDGPRHPAHELLVDFYTDWQQKQHIRKHTKEARTSSPDIPGLPLSPIATQAGVPVSYNERNTEDMKRPQTMARQVVPDHGLTFRKVSDEQHSRIRRILLLHKPTIATSWLPRIVFYLLVLYALLLAYSIVADSLQHPGTSVMGSAGIIATIVTMAVLLRSIAIRIDRKDKQ